VLADIARRGADVTVNLGDICASALWQREYIRAAREPEAGMIHTRWNLL
jgi:hypothetical protein